MKASEIVSKLKDVLLSSTEEVETKSEFIQILPRRLIEILTDLPNENS